MRRMIAFIILVSVFFAGCSSSSVPYTDQSDIPNAEFTTEGYFSTLDDNTLLIQDQKGLQIIDLTTKQIVKEISLVGNQGSDISGDIIVWSDLRNEKRNLEELGDIEKANSDIYIYNIKTGEQKQLTSDPSAQLSPKIWQNYVIWQDNRNDASKDYPGKWCLYLYDLNTGDEQVVTSTLAAHSTYNIHNFRIVWEDDRNNKASNDIWGGNNLPENN